MIIIGDVHGKLDQYKKIIDSLPKGTETTQVGDFGFKYHHEWHLKNIDSNLHKINFGNHDDYTFLRKNHSLGDSYFYTKKGIMSVRGAFSIDRSIRTEGVDWWRNEELNYIEMKKVIHDYEFFKPPIMVTHECPQSVRDHLFGIKETSITSMGFESMFEIHQPELWIFGHHHISKNKIINGTKFVCLSELEIFNI
jgi:hypothetical protein